MADNFSAAEVFRQVPLARPAALFHGTRKALIFLICTPGIALLAGGLLLWLGPKPEPFLLLPESDPYALRQSCSGLALFAYAPLAVFWSLRKLPAASWAVFS